MSRVEREATEVEPEAQGASLRKNRFWLVKRASFHPLQSFSRGSPTRTIVPKNLVCLGMKSSFNPNNNIWRELTQTSCRSCVIYCPVLVVPRTSKHRTSFIWRSVDRWIMNPSCLNQRGRTKLIRSKGKDHFHAHKPPDHYTQWRAIRKIPTKKLLSQSTSSVRYADNYLTKLYRSKPAAIRIVPFVSEVTG